MNAPERGALMLVRFVSVAVICVGLLMEALYLADCLAHAQPHGSTPPGPLVIGKLHCFLLALPIVAGIVMLAKSPAIAEWLADKLDL